MYIHGRESHTSLKKIRVKIVEIKYFRRRKMWYLSIPDVKMCAVKDLNQCLLTFSVYLDYLRTSGPPPDQVNQNFWCSTIEILKRMQIILMFTSRLIESLG